MEPLRFFNIHCRKTSKTLQGYPLEKKVLKSFTMRKKLKGDPLVSPGIVCYAEKRNIFLFQFLLLNGQI